MQSVKASFSFVFVLLMAVAVVGPAEATVHNVFTNGNLQTTIAGAAPGDTILVHPNSYTESLVINGQDDLHIVAVDAGGLPIAGVPIGVGGSFFSSVFIDGTGLGMDCVRVVDSDRVVIEGLVVHGCDGHAFHIVGSGPPIRDVRVSGTIVDTPAGAAYFIDNARRVQITGNHAVGSAGTSGVVLVDSKFCTIGDNILSDHVDAGIQILPGNGYHQVFNNDVFFNDIGILDEGDDSRIEWNHAHSNFSCGIELTTSSVNADLVSNSASGSYCLAGVGTEFGSNS